MVAQTEEAFWYYDEIVVPTATRTWHGAAPRLASHDGDGSYGRIHPGNEPVGGYHGAGIQLPAFDWPAEGIRIRAQVRFTGTWDGDFTTNGYFAIVAQTTYYRWILDWNVAGPDNPTEFWEYRATHDPEHPGWALLDFTAIPNPDLIAEAATGNLWVCALTTPDADDGFEVSWIQVGETDSGPVEGRLAIDTHDHPFHVVGTRDSAMPYELVIDTGTQRLVEIVAGEEALATHELVIDETGRPGDPWTHCGLFRPI